ncbi:1,4-alpha-glucan branching enzyme [Planctomycetes bacterium Pan216]|uniref:1,4-alpha-glucan branching enzyme n=1 Tax=Kolteria novifilia TaxID=2527975 RepID=A0A518B9J0_9BACT|nr:1,4-alpha-glucan branching enzyme [Planctomycetes bacterium Pan216]
MARGCLCLVLHAHLPFVRHPEFDEFLEEDWLFEAITETYIPLLQVLEGLEQDGIDYRLTISISPTLAAMLSDALLQERYLRHLDNLVDLAHREIERTRWIKQLNRLAKMYAERFEQSRDFFSDRHGGDLLRAFAHAGSTGCVELITCPATHGYLPLMTSPRSTWAQIEMGCREFDRHLGHRPRGIWIPECGYVHGLDQQLRDAGIDYFFTETHALLFSKPRSLHGVYAPIRCPDSGLVAAARDFESTRQVWSSVEGYPGDPAYRDFYRDVGYDLEYGYLRPHLHRPGLRSQTGVKYHRITGRTDDKDLYDPELAMAKAREHAADFVRHRRQQVQWLEEQLAGQLPIIVAPYDAELFGHWWYEGPEWLNSVLRDIAEDRDSLETITIPEYLERSRELQISEPGVSSWGANGYNQVWLDHSNDWIYPHLHAMEAKMIDLARTHADATGPMRRALNQAARELMLAQSSDWAFIMSNGTATEYATQRTQTHVVSFDYLAQQIEAARVDESWLREIESRHNCFPTIDYRLYA